jgi:uncharacterized membrane protein
VLDFVMAQGAPHIHQKLVLLGDWHPWVQLLVIVVTLGVLGLSYFNYRQTRPVSLRLILLSFRLVVVALLLAIFYQPAILEEEVVRGRNVVPILVDTSESMNLAHGAQSRMSYVHRFIQQNRLLWEQLDRDNDVVFHTFGERLSEHATPWSPAASLKIPPCTDNATRIVGALEEIRDAYQDQDLGAIIILSDGIETEQSKSRRSLAHSTQALLAELGAPIFSFALPDDKHLKDVQLLDVAYNDFAFLSNSASLEATFGVFGYDEATSILTVRLMNDGREISVQRMTVKPGQHVVELSFEFVPQSLGKHIYTIVADPLNHEIYEPNNKKDLVVNVIRDKVRVLHIAGQPSWDARFLRNHLVEDPNVDLIAFFILLNADNVQAPGPDDSALIPFPAHELFEEELGSFDLIIFQNFNYGPFQTRRYLPNIAKFVLDGGAFAMVGGPLSFSPGGYYGTPIMEILPIDIPDRFAVRALPQETSFQVSLTHSGRNHPITRLSPDPALNIRSWQETESLAGVNWVTQSKPDALVLLAHPTLQDDTLSPLPVVSIGEYGQGRSMAITTNSLWHWSFQAGMHGKDPHIYDTFWSQAVRWLIKDPAMALIQLEIDQAQVNVGQEVQATIHAFSPNYEPAAHTPIQISVRQRGEVSSDDAPVVVHPWTELLTDKGGRTEISWTFKDPGVYEIITVASLVPGRQTEASDIVVVSAATVEFQQVTDHGEFLKQLALHSGGKAAALTTDSPRVEPLPSRFIRSVNRRHFDMWNNPILFMCLCALMGTEWWLRRRSGFL